MKKIIGFKKWNFPGHLIGLMVTIILGLAAMLLLQSCNKCNKDCGRCGVLDEDACECIYDVECLCQDGIQNGKEEYIDCGGDCDPCVCKYQPCELLTGGDIKSWGFTETVEIIDPTYELDDCDYDWSYTFQVNHVVESGCPGMETRLIYVWTMDDPENPEKFFFTDPLGAQYVYFVRKLTTDSLIIEEQFGVNLYIAKE
jgi:hypothetical protein